MQFFSQMRDQIVRTGTGVIDEQVEAGFAGGHPGQFQQRRQMEIGVEAVAVKLAAPPGVCPSRSASVSAKIARHSAKDLALIENSSRVSIFGWCVIEKRSHAWTGCDGGTWCPRAACRAWRGDRRYIRCGIGGPPKYRISTYFCLEVMERFVSGITVRPDQALAAVSRRSALVTTSGSAVSQYGGSEARR